MSFFTKMNTKITPFINNAVFRYSHHHSLSNIPTYTIKKNNIIINLLGEIKSVDTASWEIKLFAADKSLHTANIVYNSEMLNHFLLKRTFLQFIVNRCYDISCDKLIQLNQNIIYSNVSWKPYNLYVLPDTTNRFNTCKFIKNCNKTKFIVYPLAASQESKRRDINILIDN